MNFESRALGIVFAYFFATLVGAARVRVSCYLLATGYTSAGMLSPTLSFLSITIFICNLTCSASYQNGIVQSSCACKVTSFLPFKLNTLLDPKPLNTLWTPNPTSVQFFLFFGLFNFWVFLVLFFFCCHPGSCHWCVFLIWSVLGFLLPKNFEVCFLLL